MNIRTHAPTVINSGAAATNWVLNTGATLAAGTTPDGVAALKGVSASGGNLRINYAPAGGVNLLAAKGIEVEIYCETPTLNDPPDGVVLAILLANDSGFVNFVTSGTIYIRPGWNKIRLGRRDFTTGGGSPTWATDVAVVRFNFALETAQVLTMYIKDLSSPGFARPQIPIIFDDGYESVYDEAFPYMAARGLVGTIGVISSKVGTSGFMTEAQLDELHDAGWAMCNHTQLHQQNVLKSASQTTCYNEIIACRDYLVSKSWTRDNEHLHFFSPYGEWSDAYLAAAVQAGCLMHRSTIHTNSAQTSDPPMSDTPGNLFPVGCIGLTNAWTLANITDRIDRIISGGRTTAGLLYHNIVTPAFAGVDTTVANFQGAMDYCYRRKAVCDYPTVPELYKHWQDVAEYA